MRFLISLIVTVFLFACNSETKNTQPAVSNKPAIIGTWKLIRGIIIEKADTTVTDYTKNQSFIKIINDTHFSFLLHDINSNKDSLKTFSAGGGKYTLNGNSYTEHLEYCSDRGWEGHDFSFTITISNDTLTQTGIEKIEAAGVDRVNTEIYVRAK